MTSNLCQQNGSHSLGRIYLNTFNWQNFHPNAQVPCSPAQVRRHIGCVRSRTRRWVTVLGHSNQPQPCRDSPVQQPAQALQTGGSSHEGYSVTNSYTSCHQPIFCLLSLTTGMHWVRPGQNQTCSWLLCPDRCDLRGPQVSATSSPVLLFLSPTAAAQSRFAPESSSQLVTPTLPVFHELHELFPSRFCWVWFLILIDVDKILW